MNTNRITIGPNDVNSNAGQITIDPDGIYISTQNVFFVQSIMQLNRKDALTILKEKLFENYVEYR